MSRCLTLTLLILLATSAAHCQQCSRLNSTMCSEPSNMRKDSLQEILHSLKSSVIILDILSAGETSNHHGEVTILSALIDIGVIPAKGDSTKKDPDMYIQWMEIFKSVANPVIFFTEKYSVAEKMLSIRQGRTTVVVVIEKNSTWAFGYLGPRYSQIYEDINYPKHHPNTVYAEYASVTHLKMELMQIISTWNYFQTTSAAWLDIGAYKAAVDDQDFRPFSIKRLAGYDQTKVTLNNIRDPKPREHDHRFIMKYSPSIYAGGFWIGHMNVLQTFTSEYRRHVEILLDEGLANCEEQVMGSMFVDGTQFKPLVEVQPFKANKYTNCDRWLCLAHQTREQGLL